MLALLGVAGCADCGLRDLLVLEFAHVTDKRGDIADRVTHGYSLRRIVDEIERCEVVCGN